jgi:sugar lactone lactonase YvrE
MKLERVSLLLAVGIGSLAAWAQSAPDDPSVAARASLERIQALRKERPGDGVLVFYQALVHVSLGERDAALELLRSLKGRKLGLIPVRDVGFDSVWDDQEFQKIRKALADDEPQTPASPVAFRLKDPKLIPEGIAYDAEDKRFFIGSVAQHKIVAAHEKELSDFSCPTDRLDAVLGLTVDPTCRHLYAITTNGVEESAKKERRNAVVQYDLKDGHLTDRFAAPDAMQLNDLAVAQDGTLYVTDSETGSLFRKKPEEKALTKFGATGALRGANGIALAPDGALYVTLSTGGIDGLYWHDGDLIGIQNSTNPGRVIRIALTDKGMRIAGVTVLQSHHHPEFNEPTTGAIANGALHVIANSYVGHYQPDGTIKDTADLKRTAIVAVPLQGK